MQEPIDFAEFYASAKDDCLRAVLASTGDRQAAEDLVAEALARAWAAWPTVSRHPAPRAWVVRTALNTRVSWWRRRHREMTLGPAEVSAAGSRALDGSALAGSALDGSALGRAAPDSGGIEPGVVGQDLMAALLRLPLRQRQVVGLRVFLDLDTAATARVLGIAPGTVTAHLARAMATLREDALLTREQETR
ncbi:MAG TPA: sigma-70 family RNA polymerase sigma factor [Streptosporangiaceae bacterium]